MTERKTARQIAIETGKCPMCDDCPDGCPLHEPDDSRNAMAAFDVTIDGEEWARLLAVESEYAAFRSGKKGIEEHYAALREIERLKAEIARLTADLAASRRREEAAVKDLTFACGSQPSASDDASICDICIRQRKDGSCDRQCFMNSIGGALNRWEWRGVAEKKEDAE